MIDRSIVKYNVDFVFRNFKYKSGAVAIDLADTNNMIGIVEADWSEKYATYHLKKVLTEATGIGGGWDLTGITVERSIFNRSTAKYSFVIKSRLYTNLRKIHERPTRNERTDDNSDGTY